MIRIGTVWAGSAGIVGVAEKMEGELPLGRAGITQAEVGALVAVMVVLDYAARVESREIDSPSEAVPQTAAAAREATRGEAAAFGEKGELRRAFAALADDVDNPGHGIRTVDRALRTARNFEVIDAVHSE